MKQPDRKQFRTQEEIFVEALEKANPQERAAYLDGACGKSSELRRQVDALLVAHFSDDSLLKGAAVDAAVTLAETAPVSEGPGSMIRNFKLLQKIGEGGMGVVYMAQQEEPVKRKVALKIIKVGMDTRQVVARFEAERQALAMMDHPNIARVLDGGSTDSGRSFFVMELVQGVPITEFCDKNKLSMKERIELLIPVCQAIQSAHQKGIIHRDIKPSNVMVSLHHGEPMPKVIDFGIAKATNQKLTEKTLFTNYAHMIGTPAYMSPEQAEMSTMDVDTRTDVYSLGVLLYELLTGTTPFSGKHLRSVGYGEMQRIIAEDEPDKPSTRMSTMGGEQKTAIARSRGMQISALGHSFKGDLDWIAMKCLEKDRRRRYDTPNEMAADLKRHLNNEPVSAAAPTMSYQFHKFYRRNQVLVRAAVLVLLTVIGAILVSGGFALRMAKLKAEADTARERAAAEAENALSQAAIAEAVNQFLNEDLLGMANPEEGGTDIDIKLREVLDIAAFSVERRFADKPLIEAAIRKTIGSTYHGLTEDEKALQHLEKARSLYLEHSGAFDVNTLEIRDKLASVYLSLRRFEVAETLLRENLKVSREALGESHEVTVRAMLSMANWYDRNEVFDEQQALLTRVLRIQEQLHGGTSLQATRAKLRLAYFHHSVPMSTEDNPQFREVLSICDSKLDPRSPILSRQEHFDWQRLQMNAWRGLYSRLNDMREVSLELEELAQKILKFTTQVYGDSHPNTLRDRSNYSLTLKLLGKRERAHTLLEENLRIASDRYGEASPQAISDLVSLAFSSIELGDLESGLKYADRSYELAKGNYPLSDSTRVRATRVWAYLLWTDGNRVGEAQSVLREGAEGNPFLLFMLSALESFQEDFDASRRTITSLVEKTGGSNAMFRLERCLKSWALLPDLPQIIGGVEVQAIASRLETLAVKSDRSADPHVRIALGSYNYRRGEFQQALEYLKPEAEPRAVRYSQVGETASRRAVYPALASAFLAMTMHQMGDTDGAQERLKRAKQIMGRCLTDVKTLGKCSGEDGLRFVVILREAEQLITGSIQSHVPVENLETN